MLAVELCSRESAYLPWGPSGWWSLWAGASLLCLQAYLDTRGTDPPHFCASPWRCPASWPPPAAYWNRVSVWQAWAHPALHPTRPTLTLRSGTAPASLLHPLPHSPPGRLWLTDLIPLQVHGRRRHRGLQLAGTPSWEICPEAGGEGKGSPGVGGMDPGHCSH